MNYFDYLNNQLLILIKKEKKIKFNKIKYKKKNLKKKIKKV